MSRLAPLAVAFATTIGAVSCASDAGSEPTRTYSLGLEADDSGERYRYVATDAVDIRVGDEVTFVFDNTGALPHDLQIVDPEGVTVATAPPVPPGGQASVTARFDEAGFFRLNCLVGDHLTVHEMQTIVEVTESTG
jgi:plastocyanin